MIKKPKIAILLCGHIRTWEKCKNSFKNYFKDIDYDLYIHTYNNITNYHPHFRGYSNPTKENIRNKLYQNYDMMCCRRENAVRNYYDQSKRDLPRQTNKVDIRMAHNPDFIRESLDIPHKACVIEDEKEVSRNFNMYQEKQDRWIRNNIEIRLYLQYRKLKLCYELVKESGIEYDYVIRTRFDLNHQYIDKHINELLDNLKEGEVLTSTDNVQPNDHILICTPENLDSIINNHENVKLERYHNPHEYLDRLLTMSNLKYVPLINRPTIMRY